MMMYRELIDRLCETHNLTDEEFKYLIEAEYDEEYLFQKAENVRKSIYGTDVFVRGLIEISNYCKNDCYYCGIRHGNKCVERYRLSEEDILFCCDEGYELGFRTFVLQGGEDPYYTTEKMCGIVRKIKEKHPDCAVTLSIGELTDEAYKALFEAGADRYLLRHETADDEHYHMLHPEKMSLANRKECLFNLKKIGFQVGSGIMVEPPYQTTELLVKDLRFLQELDPEMLGIGPYITHHQTPFKDFKSGSFEKTLRLLAILRLMFPFALIPATTALGTIHPQGRELGMKAGANVVMPNLSPEEFRKQYSLYDNKIGIGDDAAQNLDNLRQRMDSVGYQVVVDRGDCRK